MFDRLLKIEPQANHSIFLLGPRGTGKTFWLKQNFPDATYIDLLHTETYTDLLANPSRLEFRLPKMKKNWVIIDEVQKIPALLNEVHRLIEHKGYRFILTGSSARNLRKKGVNLLAGRALAYQMHPLTAQEIGSAFSIAKALQWGTLPHALVSTDPKHYLETYVSTYLREEILQEGLVRQLSQFARFLEVASFSQGNVMNVSAISREAGIDRRTVSGFFEIIHDLLIGRTLPIFTKHAKRALIAHPKFYFFDTGVFNTIRPMGILDNPEAAAGAALETLFLQHCLAINDYYRYGYQCYYWRTRNHLEVDFILYGERGLFAFEIKRKKRYQGGDLKGLHAFGKDYPDAKLFLIYGGDHMEYQGNITIMPITQALMELASLLA